MSKLLRWFPMVLLLGACAGLESRNDDEHEIRRLYAGMDEALVRGDVDVFERAFAPEYVFSHHFGRFVSRADNLEYLRRLKTAPSYRILEATSDDVVVRVAGDVGWLTAAWRVVIVGLETGSIPHEDRGRYTGIYRKQDGRWRVVAEHLSEAHHDPEAMKIEVTRAAKEFRHLLRTGNDPQRLDRMVARDYRATEPGGNVLAREELARMRFLWAAEPVEQEFRVIDNATALETGRLQGALRYTAVWSWRDLRWQLLSTHFSGTSALPPAATLFLDRDGSPVIRYSLSGATSEGRFVDTRPETHATARQKFWAYDKACFEIEARRMRKLADTCGPAEVRLTWDEQIRDRMYPGVMRLKNGGVLVATQYLQPLTNDGQLVDWVVEAPKGGVVALRGEKSATSIVLGARQFDQDGRGYAYLGPDEFVETKVGRVLVDHGVPQRISDEVLRLGPLLLEVIGQRLGRAPSERPSLFLTWVDRQGSQRHTQADVVPGAVVRFGMSGSWWGSGDEAAMQQIRKLLAHELVHFWNAEVFKPISWSASWVPEGNAELLALSALLAIGEMTPEQAAQQVSSAINDCIFLARGRSWPDLYHYEKHAGRGPYVCGLAYQFAAVAAAAKSDAKTDAFEFWKRTWAETPRYYEAVLQAHFLRTRQPAVAESFGALFTDKSAPLAGTLRKILADAGLDTAAKADPVASAVALRGPFMSALMSADCQGNFSFSTLEDRFEIVQGTEILCKTFRKGQVIRVAEDERIFEDTAKAIASANAACKGRGTVRLKADDGAELAAPCPAMPFADPDSLIQLAPDAVRTVLVK